jgi:Na+-driven multidrug efflux pump
MSGLSIAILFIVQIAFYLGMDGIVSLFTTDPAVAEVTRSCMPIILLLYAPDFVQGSMQGVIRALNVQAKASFIALGCFYLVSIPLAYVLVFHMG